MECEKKKKKKGKDKDGRDTNASNKSPDVRQTS